MFNLLRFEYRTLFLRKSFFVCLIVLLLPLLLISADVIDVYNKSGYNSSPFTILQMMMTFSNVSVLVLIFTSIFGCQNYINGTAKVIYAKGYSRTQIFFAKFIASATAAIIFFLVAITFGLVIGYSFGDPKADEVTSIIAGTSSKPEMWVYILHLFTQIMALHAFYFMIAELLRRTGVSIVIDFFLPTMILTLFFLFQTILKGIFKDNQEICDKIGEAYEKFMMYWLPTSSTSIIGSIFSGFDSIDYTVGMIVNIGYVILFGGLAWLLVAKKQITN